MAERTETMKKLPVGGESRLMEETLAGNSAHGGSDYLDSRAAVGRHDACRGAKDPKQIMMTLMPHRLLSKLLLALALIAGAARLPAQPPTSVAFDVRTHGATGDGRTVDTEAIN